MKVYYISTIFRNKEIAYRFLEFFKKSFPNKSAELLLYCHDKSTYKLSKSYRSTNIKIIKGTEQVFYTEAINILIKLVLKKANKGNICILDSDCFTTKEFHQICLSNRNRGLIFRNRDFITGDLLASGFIMKNYLIGTSKNVEDFITNEKIFYYKIDFYNGRGLTFPLEFVKKYGILNHKDFPLYASDNEFSWRLSKNIGLIYCIKAEILSNPIETNLNPYRINFGIKKRIESLFSIRSANNIFVKYKYVMAVCPKNILKPLWIIRLLFISIVIILLPFSLIKKLIK